MNRQVNEVETILLITEECFTHLQQLRSKKNNTRRSISHFFVLKIRQLYQHLGSGMLHFQFLKNRCSIICNRDISDLINLNKECNMKSVYQHFI